MEIELLYKNRSFYRNIITLKMEIKSMYKKLFYGNKVTVKKFFYGN